MPFDGRQLVARLKSELRISGNDDDPRLALLAEEAVSFLNQFKEYPVSNSSLSRLETRFIVIYVGLQYDGDEKLNAALGSILEMVRDQ